MEKPKGKFMDSPRGMYSYNGNPLPMAKQVKPECGPGANPDQKKANKLLQEAMRKDESLRGKSGM